MSGVAAKALLFAAMLAAPGAAPPPSVRPQSPQPQAVRPRPSGQLSLRALGDLALPHNDAGFIAGREPERVERWWVAIRTWTVDWLDRQGMAAASHLAGAARRLDPDLELRVVPLGSQALLVSANRWTHGNVFIVAPRDGRMRVLWTISAPDPASRRAFPVLASWSAGAVAGQGCSEEPCEAIGIAGIGALPPGPHGEARFYVHGTYFSEVGATQGGHLAIWEWDGRAARPLFAHHFTFMMDQQAPVLTVRGGELRLHVKDWFGHFYACGQCEGRQMVWRLRMEPGGVRDLGRTSLLPEVDFIDTLVDQLASGKDVTSLSAPAPAAMLRARIAEARDFEREAGIADEPVQLGMVMGWRVTGTGARRELCLATDHDVATIFTLARTTGGFRLERARELGGSAECRGPGSHM